MQGKTLPKCPRLYSTLSRCVPEPKLTARFANDLDQLSAITSECAIQLELFEQNTMIMNDGTKVMEKGSLCRAKITAENSAKNIDL